MNWKLALTAILVLATVMPWLVILPKQARNRIRCSLGFCWTMVGGWMAWEQSIWCVLPYAIAVCEFSKPIFEEEYAYDPDDYIPEKQRLPYVSELMKYLGDTGLTNETPESWWRRPIGRWDLR